MAETLNISNFPDIQSSENNQKIPLVLIHGWGLNSAVWQPLIASFSDEFFNVFKVITIDLPGFGMNVEKEIRPYVLSNICQRITDTISQPAIYLGWSLGGLVATEMALKHPNKVLGLITVASSPCFLEEIHQNDEPNLVCWPGIKPTILNSFHQQLKVDIKKTITGFLKIQAMGSPHIRQDIKRITALVFQQKIANKDTLDMSLRLLESSDHRKQLCTIEQPFFRMYGDADSLVPKAVIARVNELSQKSDFHVFSKASHAPFISHTDEFAQILSGWLIKNARSHFN
jgi:pimeloyl-[acyl-carrier protein] methyl ester esterase